MESKVPSYLRTYRKRCGLTQEEVAFLLGGRNGAKVSRFERLARTPSLENALACEVIFGASAPELFPRAYAEAEKGVIQRARLLQKRLGADSGLSPSQARQRLSSLNAIVAREGAESTNRP